jgi:hypothetical protein
MLVINSRCNPFILVIDLRLPTYCLSKINTIFVYGANFVEDF